MKRKNARFPLVFLAFLTFSLASFAADFGTNATNAVADALSAPAQSGGDLAQVIVQNYAAKHPWAAFALLIIGAARVILKPLFSYLHANKTPGIGDYSRLSLSQESPAFNLLLKCLDWLASIKLVHPDTSVDAVNAAPNYTVKTT